MFEKINKCFVQKCCMFIGATLFLISLPFWLVETPNWCLMVGYVLSMSGFILICITIVHIIIFSGETVHV